jgi:hypothetical protein
MKYFPIVLLLIALGVIALFTIKKSVALLLAAIVAIIVGYFLAVRTIAREE